MPFDAHVLSGIKQRQTNDRAGKSDGHQRNEIGKKTSCLAAHEKSDDDCAKNWLEISE